MAQAAKKSAPKAKIEDLVLPLALKNNIGVLVYLRTFASVLLGIAVGILGVADWSGFIIHLVVQLLCAVAMFFKGCTTPKAYFHTLPNLLFAGVFSSTPLLSYILFWMIFYNLCHVF